jgi:hypothetical protein
MKMTANELANKCGLMIEDYNFGIQVATMLRQQAELQTLVKSFFENYLDYQEESDSGRVFNPIHVSCTRVMMIEPLAKLLIRMRELSGVSDGA